MLYYVVIDLLAMSIVSGSLVLMSVRVQKKFTILMWIIDIYLFPISANHY